jgi:hypothetical protein
MQPPYRRVFFFSPQMFVTALPNSGLLSPYRSLAPQVRSSKASLEFFWRGVHDPAVSALYFRFLLQWSPVSEWSPLPPVQECGRTEDEVGSAGRGKRSAARRQST